MKRCKKYPFFLMIIISSLLYGTCKMLEIEQKEKVQIETVSDIGKENASNERQKEVREMDKSIDKVVQTENVEPGQVLQVEELPQKEEEPEVQDALEQEKSLQERQFQRVEMDYLDDALFIGDSRTSTLYEYAGWKNTDFFVKYGQTVWDVWEGSMDGVTLEQMLTAKQYGKIYIMLGINELGRGTPESFAGQFESVVERVRQFQPQTVIFVEAIMHVTQSKDGENTYINNQEINARNEKLKLLADNQNIFYINVNEKMDAPGTGRLKEEYSFDGVHLQVKYIDIWRNSFWIMG